MTPVLLGAATLAPGAGGIAVVARLTARALGEAGMDLRTVSYLDRRSDLPAVDRVTCCGGGKLRFAWSVQRESVRSDVCVYDSGGIARAHPWLPGTRRPYMVWMHGIEAWEALRRPVEAVLRGADRVLVNSHYTLERFERLHGPLPGARVCWLSAESDIPPPSRRDGRGPPTVLVLGRIDADQNYKGHDEMIDVWPTVVAAVPEARLLIAGGGSGLAGARRRAAGSSAAGRIEVLGFVPEERIEALWRSASVFAMPSRKEGFGLVYVEAMRHGVPIVASVHDAGPEVNLDGVTGFNVDLDRPGDLAARLIELLRDEALRARMGAAGETRWREHFTYRRFRERFLAAVASANSGA